MAYNFDPLWRTMERKKITKYALETKYKIHPRTITNMTKNQSVTLYTINRLCNILKCKIEDVVEITLDE